MSSTRQSPWISAIARSAAITSAISLSACKTGASSEPLRIAAASDLTLALSQLAPRFEKKAGVRTVVSYGASVMLADQIAHGAPFDVFAAADRGPVDSVVQRGACVAGTERPYALGQLVIVGRKGLALPASFDALTLDSVKRIALANPDHAPYGRAAMEALTRSGIVDRIRPKLVFGTNVIQALEFVRSGNADAAIVARSLVHRDEPFTSVDRAMHAPLVQTVVECSGGKGSRAHAHAFAEFLQSDEAQAILHESGFGAP